MTSTTHGGGHSSSRPHRAGAATTGAVCLLLAALSRSLWAVADGSWRDVSAPGPTDIDAAAGGLAAMAGLLLTGWLLVAILLSGAAAALPASAATGRSARRLAGRIAPAVLRHGVAAALGLTLATVPAAASAAVAGAASTSSVSLAAPIRAGGAVRIGSEKPAEHLSPAWVVPGPADTELAPDWVPRPPPRTAPAARADLVELVTSGSGSARLDPEAEVIVRRGDSLWSIARRHLPVGTGDAAVAAGWPLWYAANRGVIGADPDHLRPGTRLSPPDSASGPGVRPRAPRAGAGTIPTQERGRGR